MIHHHLTEKEITHLNDLHRVQTCADCAKDHTNETTRIKKEIPKCPYPAKKYEGRQSCDMFLPKWRFI